MRKLRVVISRSVGSLPALVMASLVPGAVVSCEASGGVNPPPPTGGSGGVTSTGGSGLAGFGGQGAGAAGDPGCTPDAGPGGAPPDAGPRCDSYEMADTYVVPLPPEGVPAEPGQICTGPTDPVESNRAAHVTLQRYSQALHLAQGQVAVEPALQADLVGLPTLEVVDATVPTLLSVQVTNVQPAAGGFTFHAEWPEPLDIESASMTVRATLQLQCPGSAVKSVQSHTHIHLCQDYGGLEWVSSCDWCTVCVPVCEMAPSPIVPAADHDGLPLARAIRLSLVPVARVGRSVILLAEHDGGAGLSYEWHASAGEIRELAPDVIVWTMPDDAGAHLIQVAVEGPDSAAVASYGLRLAA